MIYPWRSACCGGHLGLPRRNRPLSFYGRFLRCFGLSNCFGDKSPLSCITAQSVWTIAYGNGVIQMFIDNDAASSHRYTPRAGFNLHHEIAPSNRVIGLNDALVMNGENTFQILSS